MFFTVVERVYRVFRFPHSLAPNIIHIPTLAFFCAEVSGTYVNLALRKNFMCRFLMLNSGAFMQVNGRKIRSL